MAYTTPPIAQEFSLDFLIPKRSRIVFHFFEIDELVVQDPDIVNTVNEWRETEKGKWCCENATEITLNSYNDPTTCMVKFAISGKLTEKQQTFYRLKFS